MEVELKGCDLTRFVSCELIACASCGTAAISTRKQLLFIRLFLRKFTFSFFLNCVLAILYQNFAGIHVSTTSSLLENEFVVSSIT